MDKTLLNPSAPQFSRLEYSLQLSLKASTAKITSAYIVSNPSWTISFEKRCSDVMTVDCWVDMSDMGLSQQVEDSAKRLSGSYFPANGVTVKPGTIDVSHVASKITRTMAYCRVGLGRSFLIEGKNPAATALPAGYDSFCLKTNKDILYIVKNQNQLLPLYVATFEFDPQEEKRSRERPMCENCEQALASVFCTADNAYLCKDCDINLHSSKITQKHKRTQLGKGADAFGSCRIHNETIEYFCSTCHVPVCVHCKMIGHHSSGEASKHKLVRVQDAFEMVLKESSKQDSSLGKRMKDIDKQSALIEKRGKQVDSMEKALEAQLKMIYQTALDELRQVSDVKRKVLLGDMIELQRQKDEILNLEEFLEYQRTAVDMYHLLFNWSTHQAMRQSMRDFAFFRDSIDVDLDLAVDGNIKISHKEGVPTSSVSPNKKSKNIESGKQGVERESGLELGRLSLRKTADLFAEALNDDSLIGFEESSVVNDYDERSIAATGYMDDYC